MIRKIIIFLEDNSEIITNFIVIVLISLLGYKFLSGFHKFIDITLYDESNYLFHGLNLMRLGIPNAQIAPLYSLWYFILSIFQPDPIKLYYLNYELVTILLPIMIYLLLRRYKTSIIPAFLIAVYFLVCYTNFVVYPKVTHFAIIIVLISLIVSSFFRSYFYRLTAILVGSLLSSYVRPEFFISFIIVLLIYGYEIVKNFRNYNRKKILTASITIIFLSVILFWIGNPILGGNRSFTAFSQHFSLNWVKWEKSELSPWIDNQEIIKSNFGNSKTVIECFESNPDIFYKHINQNILNLPNVIDRQLKHANLFFPNSTTFRRFELLLIIVIVFLYSLFSMYLQRSNIILLLKDNFNKRKELWIYTFIYIIPVIMSIIIIYPREHYLTMLIVFLSIIIFTIIVMPEKKKNIKFDTAFIISLGISIFIVSPHASELSYFSNFKPNITVINYLRSLKIADEVNFLEANRGYNIYLDNNYNFVGENEKDVGFFKFMQQKKINMIILGNKLERYENFKNDPEWKYFLENLNQYGFIARNITDTGMKVLIKKSLLSIYRKPH